MDSLSTIFDAFKLNYEKFLVGCDALEEDGQWDREENGELDAYFANDLICVIIRLIAADGKFQPEEIQYLNDSLGFAYTIEELQSVYRECGEKIDAIFEQEIPASVAQLRALNPGLAETYRNMLRQICDVIIGSDSIVTDEERSDADRLKSMI